jgi:TolA-binding protein
MMKKLIVAICILFLATAAFSQTRSRTTSRRGTQSSKTQPAPSQPGAEAKTAGATKVADQIKNLTRFVYLLGGVAKGIEQVDDAARKNEASPAALQQNEQNKTTVKNSLRNVREGLDQLEIYFRATPGLLDSYLKLAGSASGAADAEAQAAAGHFDQAGRTMLGVVNRLTDVLLVMR